MPEKPFKALLPFLPCVISSVSKCTLQSINQIISENTKHTFGLGLPPASKHFTVASPGDFNQENVTGGMWPASLPLQAVSWLVENTKHTWPRAATYETPPLWLPWRFQPGKSRDWRDVAC